VVPQDSLHWYSLAVVVDSLHWYSLAVVVDSLHWYSLAVVWFEQNRSHLLTEKQKNRRQRCITFFWARS
jgi:hypothetical protein